jgi:hypothetical protein
MQMMVRADFWGFVDTLAACEARIREALADPLTSYDDLSTYFALLPDQLLNRFGTGKEGETHRVLVGWPRAFGKATFPYN